ncbi:hypothetical protein [Nonomuraea insulae]|uniref:Uncharacterized protein n=1 Tax=Nonomuraea insulae TaxID=1616787 RepID=A0ABW1CGX3_9ACTN
MSNEDEFALEHLNRGLTLIRQGAARAFLIQAGTLAPACSAEQAGAEFFQMPAWPGTTAVWRVHDGQRYAVRLRP